ncbi:uncharacterized protein LOC102802318 [Saccoglossus kowalevskii]
MLIGSQLNTIAAMDQTETWIEQCLSEAEVKDTQLDEKENCEYEDLDRPKPGARKASKPHSTPLTLQWLEENYEIAEGVCIPRSALYMHYLDYCEKHDTQPVNAASFGKIIRQQFPQLTTRRLGTRGQSKYHYYGIAVKEASQYFDVMYSKQGVQGTPGDVTKKDPARQTVAYSPRSKLGTLLPEFPSVKDIKLPASVQEDKVSTFIMMYRTHCQRILDTVIRANFDEVQSYLLHFWQGMPPHMLPILGSTPVINIVGVCDSILYKAISGVLMPSVLQALPDSLTQVIRKFAKQLDEWLRVALDDLPEALQNIKFDQLIIYSNLSDTGDDIILPNPIFTPVSISTGDNSLRNNASALSATSPTDSNASYQSPHSYNPLASTTPSSHDNMSSSRSTSSAGHLNMTNNHMVSLYSTPAEEVNPSVGFHYPSGYPSHGMSNQYSQSPHDSNAYRYGHYSSSVTQYSFNGRVNNMDQGIIGSTPTAVNGWSGDSSSRYGTGCNTSSTNPALHYHDNMYSPGFMNFSHGCEFIPWLHIDIHSNQRMLILGTILVVVAVIVGLVCIILYGISEGDDNDSVYRISDDNASYQIFDNAAVASDAPQCSEVGVYISIRKQLQWILKLNTYFFTYENVEGKFACSINNFRCRHFVFAYSAILKRNGSAVDTTIATLVCIGVINCHSAGIGGGHFMVVHDEQ